MSTGVFFGAMQSASNHIKNTLRNIQEKNESKMAYLDVLLFELHNRKPRFQQTQNATREQEKME